MLVCQRDAFGLPPDLHYLNCAYMSPASKRVEAAGIAGIARKRVPSELDPAAFFDESARARAAFAAVIGAASGASIAVIPAVSYAMATIAGNVRMGAGHNLVVAHEQFPSNVYAWRRLCASTGATMRTVAPPAPAEVREGRGADWNRRILAAIDADTAVVALDAVHWTDGTWFDLSAIGARAREHGALFVVDGTQSVGAQPIDVEALGLDALVCAGYKWLMGPYSLGFAHFGARLRDGVPLEETWIARAGSEDFRALVDYRDAYQPGAVRFDVGERSNFALMPMACAALEQLLEWGVERIADYCGALGDRIAEGARALGFAVEPRPWRAAHLLGLRAPASVTDARLGAALAAHRVSVSLRGGAIRVSPHVYNDARDVDALLAALAAACG